MGRKMVVRRRFSKKSSNTPVTPSPSPTPSPPHPPPQPSPPPSPQNQPPATRPRHESTKPPQNKPTVRRPTTRQRPEKPPSPSTRKRKTSAATDPPSSDPSSSKRRRTASSAGIKILSGRVFADPWISKPVFKFLLDAIQTQGWSTLLSFTDAVYEEEVKEFYQTLEISDVLELKANVNGVSIHMGVDTLADVLGVPYVGFSYYKTQNWSFVYGVDNATISRTISDHPIPHAQIFPTFYLSAHNKLLRNLVTKTILPIIENRGECLIMDQFLLWLLLNDHPISVPHLMMLHMQHVSQSPHFYPYGLWLTRVFRAFDVIQPTSVGITVKDIMSDGVLSRMELCVLKGELLKKDFLGFTPREACEGCLKMMEDMRDMKKQMQQLLARQRASDTLAAQRHRQLLSKPKLP